MTVAPDDNSKTVLSHGTPHVLMRSMLFEGQTHPSSRGGAKLQWKNAQNQAKKNINSDRMNNPNPSFISP